MKIRPYFLVFAILTILVATLAVGAQTTATVRVRCNQGNQGKKINEALERHRNADILIIEVEGMCNENVIITRNRVTLRGTDPATDGIQAVFNTADIDAALWVKEAHEVTVENLKLTSGFIGLLATGASTPHLRVVNSRIEGNSRYGVNLEASLFEGEGATISNNGFINVASFQASRFQCTNCTIADPGAGIGANLRTNILNFGASSLVLNDSQLLNGGINSTNSVLTIADTTINGFMANGASLADSGGTGTLIRTTLSGHISLNSGSNLNFSGVAQTAAALANVADNQSYLRIADASPLGGGPPTIPSNILGFILRGFSTGVLIGASQITGSLNCSQGANQFCANPANISGTSNCALCPKP